MTENRITAEKITGFAQYLRQAERSSGTIENYLRHVRAFAAWLGGGPVSKEAAAGWKAHLLDKRQLFRDDSKELTRAEYDRLITAAHALGRERLALLMETICATGIRVSEVQYLTVEAVERGRAEISLKGKIRTILIPGKLRRKLLKYARKNKTVSGEIFRTRNGKGLSRKQIWAEMKAICKAAGVEASKVFPHNLRHLFARTFYKVCRDVAKLADVLGHSSIETTRIYLISTGAEHASLLERLGLVG